MIKINKSSNSIPESLIPPSMEMGNSPSAEFRKTTHLRRIEIIENGGYIDDPKYNSRYKYQDIKKALIENIYRHKCAFCEQRVELLHIEHYRPKKKDDRYEDSYAYYWLAFSWDNLLVACPTCNTHKSTHFAVGSTRVVFENSAHNLKNINALSAAYDDIEQPMLVNPEVTDPSCDLTFTLEGEITSTNLRLVYTIETCKLNREDLKDQRNKLLNDLRSDIKSEVYEYRGNIEKQKEALSTLMRKFKRSAQNNELPFLAFRRYAIDNDWFKIIIKEIVRN